MIRFLSTLFRNVIYTCRHCAARQRIPLRRVHFFERFHELDSGQPLLIACPHCGKDVQMPSPYRTHTGHDVIVDPQQPPNNAVIHSHY